MAKIDNYIFKGKELDIIIYPDPILKKKACIVAEFNSELLEIANNMLFTMYNAPGIGLAAPQIGSGIRMFVIDTEFKSEEIDGEDTYSNFAPHVFINPEITIIDKEKIKYQEGCLSFPGIYDDVLRFKEINIKYQDLEGNQCEMNVDGLLAICIQHENDHLNGITFIEHLSSLKRSFYQNKITKYKKKIID